MIDSKYFQAGRETLSKLFYTDTVKVYRNTLENNVQAFRPLYEGVKCHLSNGSVPALAQGNQIATADNDLTLYCLPDTDIQEGDRVEVDHMGTVYKCDVGTIFITNLDRRCKCTERGTT